MPSAIPLTMYQVRPTPACISGRLTQRLSLHPTPGQESIHTEVISAATPKHRRQRGLLKSSREPIPCQPAIHGHLHQQFKVNRDVKLHQ
ncbi:hypothetical protein K443DRAFT_192742 [Laccaria amethystina LaAM-08-1]|uniref:Uncharacterized protein n=1 Tax=Laccaria amethystina LaAM-08-1 TaxID=1095629 RepID=A0A0C9XSI7_9AGAR|nr:hypothetical protein K443DRAFT_192742 [Laccaria amethystina LaAM-08-1]